MNLQLRYEASGLLVGASELTLGPFKQHAFQRAIKVERYNCQAMRLRHEPIGTPLHEDVQHVPVPVDSRVGRVHGGVRFGPEECLGDDGLSDLSKLLARFEKRIDRVRSCAAKLIDKVVENTKVVTGCSQPLSDIAL